MHEVETMAMRLAIAQVRLKALEEAAKIVENYDPDDPAVEGRHVLSRAIRAAVNTQRKEPS